MTSAGSSPLIAWCHHPRLQAIQAELEVGSPTAAAAAAAVTPRPTGSGLGLQPATAGQAATPAAGPRPRPSAAGEVSLDGGIRQGPARPSTGAACSAAAAEAVAGRARTAAPPGAATPPALSPSLPRISTAPLPAGDPFDFCFAGLRRHGAAASGATPGMGSPAALHGVGSEAATPVWSALRAERGLSFASPAHSAVGSADGGPSSGSGAGFTAVPALGMPRPATPAVAPAGAAAVWEASVTARPCTSPSAAALGPPLAAAPFTRPGTAAGSSALLRLKSVRALQVAQHSVRPSSVAGSRRTSRLALEASAEMPAGLAAEGSSAGTGAGAASGDVLATRSEPLLSYGQHSPRQAGVTAAAQGPFAGAGAARSGTPRVLRVTVGGEAPSALERLKTARQAGLSSPIPPQSACLAEQGPSAALEGSAAGLMGVGRKGSGAEAASVPRFEMHAVAGSAADGGGVPVMEV